MHPEEKPPLKPENASELFAGKPVPGWTMARNRLRRETGAADPESGWVETAFPGLGPLPFRSDPGRSRGVVTRRIFLRKFPLFP
jgi:hypothetical protein